MPHAHASGFPSPCVWLADRLTPVGQDRLILTRSGAGAPELQSGPDAFRYSPALQGGINTETEL